MTAQQISQRISIVGSGLSGPLLAIYLARRGIGVDLFERRPDMRKEKISAGRSINLALSTRGIFALEEVGLGAMLLEQAIPMRGRMIHTVAGEKRFAQYGKDDSEYINSISRAGLSIALMNAAEKYPGVKIHFNERCVGVNFNSTTLKLYNEETREVREHKAEVIIGTDGAGSAVRMEMFKIPGFDFSQSHLEHGYKELCIPAGTNGSFQMEKNSLHIWPRGGYMLIALPNLDGSFTCTLFFAHKGSPSFETLDSPQSVTEFFAKVFPDASALMPTLTEDFFANPTGYLATVKCFPWHVAGKVLLLGDAAHAIVPFYGQGMNCSFEDCTMLNECIEKCGPGWENIFVEFEKLRKVNTDAIADLALDNFIEMRDLVGDPKFLLKKEIEHALEDRYPGKFISKYSMVTFHRLPYSEAMRKGRLQDRVIAEVCKGASVLSDVNLEQVYQRMQKEF